MYGGISLTYKMYTYTTLWYKNDKHQNLPETKNVEQHLDTSLPPLEFANKGQPLGDETLYYLTWYNVQC